MAEPSDQDKLSDDWNVDDTIVPVDGAEQTEEEKAAEAAAEWAAMLEGDTGDGEGGPDRVLNQDEIDSLLGFDASVGSNVELTGVQALINSALVSYERLPMLEIVFDRLVRLTTTSLRNFTSDNVEVTLDSISSVRFGDYLNSIPLPAILSVIKAEEWENYGLLTVDSSLIYSMIDVLLGGRRIGGNIRVEGRPYTTIELALARRMIEVILDDTHRAFEPVTNVNFKLERMETNPRFAAISRPGNAAILIELRIEMDDRGGKIEILLPYATIEPIREQLLQMFMGEKFGRDPIWEGHLATEIYSAEVDVEAVLHEQNVPLSKMMTMQPGDTLMFERSPSDPVRLRCGDVELTEAIMGHIGNHVSVRVTRPLNPPKVTMEAFEAIDEKLEGR
ncbi:flagellar motor switch protein FliM [Devosia sp. J2-20]|jgi:flagellar motor switch protein FliM|uniref:Flagellar motor switch protein FliM n=1 Tax=Devosia litorisediminis TaxID=2829817 RepID=A0A942I5R4_9HYPH|nr:MULTISPECIES: flagellar motor switch protein FliM [Devosia]MBS3847913.1 flagellar motor switch protein FliM [Devosia litorisediminis]MCZ4345893.1 flagellar motor switch protein FliM [Devosia neptuniae]WDQ98979.1 flagellar motor switch protein FliM [Devosia sp. J2-20]|tara:strand:- start:8064 stop:9236 length:1173 start_codon:yes stop_codon:yes gene_type:complete